MSVSFTSGMPGVATTGLLPGVAPGAMIGGPPGGVAVTTTTPGAMIGGPPGGVAVTTTAPGAVIAGPADPTNYVAVDRDTTKTVYLDKPKVKIQVVEREVPIKEIKYRDIPVKKIVYQPRYIEQIQYVPKDVPVPVIKYVDNPVYTTQTVERPFPVVQTIYKDKPTIVPHFKGKKDGDDGPKKKESGEMKAKKEGGVTEIDQKTVTVTQVAQPVPPMVGSIPSQSLNVRKPLNEMLPGQSYPAQPPVASPPILTTTTVVAKEEKETPPQKKKADIITDFGQLSKINQSENKELFHSLHAERKLPPKVFHPPSDLKKILETIRNLPQPSPIRGKYLSYPIIPKLTSCLAGKHIPSEYLDMIEYIILNLDIHFNDFDDAKMMEVINDIDLPSSETTLNGKIEDKLTQLICEKIKEKTEDSSIVTYADIIESFTDENEYFPELIHYLNFIN